MPGAPILGLFQNAWEKTPAAGFSEKISAMHGSSSGFPGASESDFGTTSPCCEPNQLCAPFVEPNLKFKFKQRFTLQRKTDFSNLHSSIEGKDIFG